jgi:NDP-sugar pyrophosphorylase family protein
MAGEGKRFADFGYTVPKPLIRIHGKTMIERAVEGLGIDGRYTFVVRQYEEPEHRRELDDILCSVVNKPNIVYVDYLTEGPVCSCLLAEELINYDDELIIADCDLIMCWDPDRFLEAVRLRKCDAAVVTYNIKSMKNSYVKLNEHGYAVQFAEKQIISEHSLNGIHYWKHGSDFVNASKQLINQNIRVNNEFYISMTHNELIKMDKKIIAIGIKNEAHHAVGTPEDLVKFITSHFI